MTQAVDPATGTTKGPAQRVTLDAAQGLLDVSPDGTLIAYTTTRWSDGNSRLQVVPARGGPVKSIQSARNFYAPRFAPDGQSVYITAYSFDGQPSKLLRVPVRGGDATLVMQKPSFAGTYLSWKGAEVTIHTQQGHFTAVTLHGDTLWSISNATRPVSFSPDGKSTLVTTSETGAGVRLFPLNGGKPHDITAGDTYDYPSGWSADGQRVFIETPGGTKNALVSVSVDGKHRESIPSPTNTSWKGLASIVGDGRFLVSQAMGSASDKYRAVFDTKTRTQTTVGHTADFRSISGPGGYWSSVPALYFLDRDSNGTELRKLGDDGQLRTVRRLSFDVPAKARRVSFANDRLAYWVTEGDSAVLYLADADLTPKRVYAFRGFVNESSLSFDGSALAAVTTSGPKASNPTSYVTLLSFSRSGDLDHAPRLILTIDPWDLLWLRDNRSVIAMQVADGGMDTRVLKFSLDAAQSVNLTAGEKMTFWDQYPSPDGKWTVLPVEKARGGSIWRVDLEAAAKAWQERKRK